MLTKTRVLLVDDDEDDYLIVKNIIAKIPNVPFSLDWVSDTNKAAQLIAEKQHDAYLIDYRLGARTGLELLAQFNLPERTEPFIILTGAGDEKIEREAMDIGAADYLVKGSFDAELLSRVIRYSIQRKHMEAQRIQQLIELNRSKDEFIALASHQLRTPATAVKQYIGMLLEGYAGELTEAQTNFLTTAYNSNERQLGVVNDILKVAQLDLEKIVLRPRKQDLREVIQTVIQDLQPHIDDRRQTLEYKEPQQPVYAEIDPEFFRMALSNIADNASKYTPEGKSLSIRLKTQPKTVKIYVKDQGVGIAAEDMDKLFKKFSRIGNSLSVKVGGTGLGLYWANEIVELHKGSLKVSSIPEKGSEFVITVPVKAS